MWLLGLSPPFCSVALGAAGKIRVCIQSCGSFHSVPQEGGGGSLGTLTATRLSVLFPHHPSALGDSRSHPDRGFPSGRHSELLLFPVPVVWVLNVPSILPAAASPWLLSFAVNVFAKTHQAQSWVDSERRAACGMAHAGSGLGQVGGPGKCPRRCPPGALPRGRSQKELEGVVRGWPGVEVYASSGLVAPWRGCAGCPRAHGAP